MFPDPLLHSFMTRGFHVLKKSLFAAALAAAGSLFSIAHAQTTTAALRVIGLTDDQRLISFNTAAPRLTTREIGVIAGLAAADTQIVGIDFRIQDGLLYGVGNGGGVYTIDLGNATATRVNSLSTPLAGSRFGVDFNPAADRLRIVSDSGQNLRHNVNAGGVTLTDGLLNNGAVPPVTTLGVASAAYTNNDLATTTSTVLFDINAATGFVALQAPPNAGVLANIGALLVDATGAATPLVGRVGFDIYTRSNRAGVTVGNAGFAALTTATGTAVYSVDLSSGVASSIGTLASGITLVDLALPLNQ